MAEEFFQGGVCGGTWWNPNTLFCGNAGGGGGGVVGFSSPCSVAQLGGYDMGSFGWPHEVIMMKTNKFNNNDDDQNCDVDDNNNLVFSSDFDSTLDILGFGFSPPPTTTTTSTTTTTNWNQPQNQFCKGENNYASIIQDNLSSCLTTSSNNSPGDSSLTSFPVTHSSAAYLIQSLFDDIDNENPHTSIIPKSVPELIDPSNYGPMDHSQVISGCPWANSTVNNSSNNNNNSHSNSNSGIQSLLPTSLQLPQGDYNNNVTTLGDIQASLLNSMQSHNCDTLTTELKQEDAPKELNKNMNDNDQPTPKRQRIETLSSLPSFKVRKEKLGDRITALQQLVSPFGKTDTASVLHEAIEYIKFLHDQVHVLTTPYLKNGAPGQQQQKVMSDNGNDNQQDLRSRGLCLVPISSTYPVAQETPVDFWTPTFGATM